MSILSWIFGSPSDRPGVYSIRNKVTGRVYIGATAGPIRIRWDKHIGSLNRDRHANRLLQEDWKRYGAGAFEFSVIENGSDHDRIFERERYWQDKDYSYDTRYNPQNEAVQRNYTTQTFRLRKSDLPAVTPEEFDQIINYFRTHPVTHEELDRVIKALRESGSIR